MYNISLKTFHLASPKCNILSLIPINIFINYAVVIKGTIDLLVLVQNIVLKHYPSLPYN